MTTRHIHAIKRQRQAIEALRMAYFNADKALKQLERRKDLHEHERHEQERTIRARLNTELGAANSALKEAQAEARALASYAPSAPGKDAAYWATEAARALDGQGPGRTLAVLRQVVAAGDAERTREYLATARKTMDDAPDLAMRREFAALRRQAEPAEARQARQWGQVCDALEQRIALSRELSEEHIAKAVGKVPAGGQPGDPINTQKLYRLQMNLENLAAQYINEVAAKEGSE